MKHRTLTTFAVAVLGLDAVLLALAAIWYRTWLFVPAGICVVAAIGVVFAWRRHRRNLAEIAAGREELKREIESIRDLLQSHSSKT